MGVPEAHSLWSDVVGPIILVLVDLAIGLYLIYDPQTLGDATGYIGHGTVSTPTPPGMVRFVGCLLVMLPLALWLGSLWWPLGLVVGLAGACYLQHLANRYWPV